MDALADEGLDVCAECRREFSRLHHLSDRQPPAHIAPKQ